MTAAVLIGEGAGVRPDLGITPGARATDGTTAGDVGASGNSPGLNFQANWKRCLEAIHVPLVVAGGQSHTGDQAGSLPVDRQNRKRALTAQSAAVAKGRREIPRAAQVAVAAKTAKSSRHDLAPSERPDSIPTHQPSPETSISLVPEQTSGADSGRMSMAGIMPPDAQITDTSTAKRGDPGLKTMENDALVPVTRLRRETPDQLHWAGLPDRRSAEIAAAAKAQDITAPSSDHNAVDVLGGGEHPTNGTRNPGSLLKSPEQPPDRVMEKGGPQHARTDDKESIEGMRLTADKAVRPDEDSASPTRHIDGARTKRAVELPRGQDIQAAARAKAVGEFAPERTLTGLAAHDSAHTDVPQNLSGNEAIGAKSGSNDAAAGNGNGPVGIRGEETFVALDWEVPARSIQWIHAGPHHAEAGYLDPALGWVGVRADATAHAIQATVLPGSAEAASVLAGHITGLNDYLSEHHGHGASVTMAMPGHADYGSAANQGNNPDEGKGRESASGNDSVPFARRERVSTQPLPSHAGDSASGGIPAGHRAVGTGGIYVSVMA